MEIPDPSWEWLADAPDRSAGWRAACAWAAGVLRDALGEDWPARASRPLGIPLEFARTHTLAMIECVELALLLDETAALPGRADVRAELRGDRTADRVAHAAAQLELAALATALGWEAHLERRHRRSATPVDVSVDAPAGPLDFEVKVLFPSERTLAWTRDGDEALDAIRSAATRLGLVVEGELSAWPDGEAVAEAVDWIEDGARLIRVGATAAPFRKHGMNLGLGPEGSSSGRLTVRAGGEDLLRRLAGAITRKGADVAAAGGGWLRAEVLSGLWMMSAWGSGGLAAKLAMIGPALRAALADAPVSVVLCSATGLAPGDIEEDLVVRDGCAAMRQRVPPLRAREVLVFSPEDPRGVGDVLELFSARRDWLERALAARGLPAVSEIVA